MIRDDCKWITTQVVSEVSDRPNNGPELVVICGPLLLCASQHMACICYDLFFSFLNLREYCANGIIRRICTEQE